MHQAQQSTTSTVNQASPQDYKPIYTQVRTDATALNNTQAVINSQGIILSNPLKHKRIDLVKELMNTWYTLSNTLLNTAYKQSLKPEFCSLLQKTIEDYQKAPRKNHQNWQKKAQKTLEKSQTAKVTAPRQQEVKSHVTTHTIPHPAESSPSEWKEVKQGFRSPQPVSPIKLIIPKLNQYEALANTLEDDTISSEMTSLIISNYCESQSSKSQILRTKARVAEKKSELEIEKLSAQVLSLQQKTALEKATAELQLIEIQEKKEAIILRRLTAAVDSKSKLSTEEKLSSLKSTYDRFVKRRVEYKQRFDQTPGEFGVYKAALLTQIDKLDDQIQSLQDQRTALQNKRMVIANEPEVSALQTILDEVQQKLGEHSAEVSRNILGTSDFQSLAETKRQLMNTQDDD